MKAKLKDAVDVMAVITNKETRASEVIDVDHVFVVSQTINWIGNVAQFVVAFGGVDSTGRLHLCPERKENLANITINEPTFSELFRANANPLRELPQSLLDEVFAGVVIPACDKHCWGLDEVEIAMDDVTVFSKEKNKPARTKAEIDAARGK